MDLCTAVTSHVTRAWEKMRKQGLVAQYLSVFAHSNRFRLDLPQYFNSTGFKLLTATDDLSYLTMCASSGFLVQIYLDPFGLRRRLRRLEAYAPRLRDEAIASPQPERDRGKVLKDRAKALAMCPTFLDPRCFSVKLIGIRLKRNLMSLTCQLLNLDIISRPA